MCGIHVSIKRDGPLCASSTVFKRLYRRGPDGTGKFLRNLRARDYREGDLDERDSDNPDPGPAWYVRSYGMVLALRGSEMVEQPYKDWERSGGFLCWNGEAWKHNEQPVDGNDTEQIFPHLCHATTIDAKKAHISTQTAVVQALRSIKGPFAFAFFEHENYHLYFGRDCLGRRSLLCRTNETSIEISSVSDGSDGWFELDANQVYVCDLSPGVVESGASESKALGVAPLSVSAYELSHGELELGLNKSLSSKAPQDCKMTNHATMVLENQLRESVELRVPLTLPAVRRQNTSASSTVAVLFSGGLDCTILARLIHDHLPLDQSIDLLNVAFENPRVHNTAESSRMNDTLDGPTSVYELCPDRITARSALNELRVTCPTRSWNTVEINVPYSETESHSEEVKSLIKPHNTEMDLSIALALYFASRGSGSVKNGETGKLEEYSSPARVLFSGLGADELFGGYQRHATAYARNGHVGLIDELQLDISRLGKRNLGRDDRVISHWGKEVRYPYLDEDFVRFSTRLPIWEKCGFGFQQDDDGCNEGLEPAKLALRLLARKLGLKKVSKEKKRAIQFGARSARMEQGKGRKAKGTDVVE